MWYQLGTKWYERVCLLTAPAAVDTVSPAGEGVLRTQRPGLHHVLGSGLLGLFCFTVEKQPSLITIAATAASTAGAASSGGIDRIEGQSGGR